MNSEQVKIEKATSDDVVMGAWLMYLAFDDLAQYLFGTRDLQKIEHYFRKLWLTKNDRMSSRYSYVIKEKDKAIALISCYEGDLTTKLILPTFINFLRINPGLLKYMFTHLSYLYSILTTPEAFKDEFYIFMLAVVPEYQRKGYGSELLKFAEQLARERNFKKVSLMVRRTNENAIKFYERNGYKIIALYDRKPLDNYKMIKELA